VHAPSHARGGVPGSIDMSPRGVAKRGALVVKCLFLVLLLGLFDSQCSGFLRSVTATIVPAGSSTQLVATETEGTLPDRSSPTIMGQHRQDCCPP